MTTSTKDTRPPWQIAVAIRLQSAVGYLCLLELDEHRRQVYEAAYKIGDLGQWVNKHIENLIGAVNQAVKEHGQCRAVPSVKAHWSEKLHARGLSGIVTLAGGGWYQD